MSRRRARSRSEGGKEAWFGRSLIVIGGVALSLLIAGYIAVRQYLKSEGFRVMLSQQASEALEVKGNFGPFHWDGLQVETPMFEAEGEGMVKSVRADKIHTEIGVSEVLSGKWLVRGSSVGDLEATLDLRKKPEVPEGGTVVKKSTASVVKQSGWLPTEVDVDAVKLDSVTLNAMTDEGDVSLAGVRAEVTAESRNAYKAELSGGRVRLPWKEAPGIELDRVKLRYRDEQVFVTDATALVADTGRAQASGEWNLRDKQYALDGDLKDLALDRMLNETWAKRLTGTLDATFRLQGKQGDTRMSGDLRIKDGVLTALPVLDSLAAYADTRRFRVLQLSEARSDWKWENGATTFDRLVLASEGLIRLEGRLVIGSKGELDGDFRLGLAPGTLANIPGAETDVFFPGEKGLLWSPLKVTGTLQDPKEDLTDRLIAAAGLRMFEVLPDSKEKVLKFTRNALTEVAPELTDKGLKVVDKGLKGLDKGLKAVENVGDVVEGVSGVLDGFFGTSDRKVVEPPKGAEQPGGPAKEEKATD